jgi:hypothetical protein
LLLAAVQGRQNPQGLGVVVVVVQVVIKLLLDFLLRRARIIQLL